MKRIARNVLIAALSVSAIGASADERNYGNSADYRSGYDSRYDNGRYGSDGPRSAFAQVLRVQPVTDPYGPYQRQECWDEQANRYDNGYYRDSAGHLYRDDGHSNTGGAIIGALVGGALGNQVGKGDGRKAATIAGAAIGAAVGSNVGRNDDYDRYSDDSGVVRRCRTITDNGRYPIIRGYKVTYSYAGQVYHSFTTYDPGRRLRVMVDVRPQDGDVAYRR